jgi:putative SOS response-associated peptidase YedK
MCGRYALYESVDEIARQLGYGIRSRDPEPRTGYNIPPGTYIPGMAAIGEEPEIVPLWWGFRPHWAGEDSPEPINARAENLARSPFFRASFAHHRCVIPANGWFEWQQRNGGKQAFYIHHKNDELLLLAGLFAVDANGNPCCCIVTENARGQARDIHSRMPVVLGEGVEAWLDPAIQDRETLKREVKHLAAEDLAFRPVSARVNSPENNDKQIIQRAD